MSTAKDSEALARAKSNYRSARDAFRKDPSEENRTKLTAAEWSLDLTRGKQIRTPSPSRRKPKYF